MTWLPSRVDLTLVRGDSSIGLSPGFDFSQVQPWAGMRRCNVTDNGDGTVTVGAYYGSTAYDDTNPLTCVYVPKFWSQVTSDTSGMTWAVSNDESDGLPVNPAFVYGNISGTTTKTVPYILIGAFQATLSAYGQKLESRSSTPTAPIRPMADMPQDVCNLALNRNPIPQVFYPKNLILPKTANFEDYLPLTDGIPTNVNTMMDNSTGSTKTISTEWSQSPPQSMLWHTVGAATLRTNEADYLPINPDGTPMSTSAYIFSVYLYSLGTPTVTLLIQERDAPGYQSAPTHISAPVTLSAGVAQRCSFMATFTSSVNTTYKFMVGLNSTGAVDIYMDNLQMELFNSTGYSGGQSTFYDTYGGYYPPANDPATGFHIGTPPLNPNRSPTGWGIETHRAHAALQTLALVENAVWDSWAVPGYYYGLVGLKLIGGMGTLDDPYPSNCAYNGYTGSYGTQLGNTTGLVYIGAAEMFTTPPTTLGARGVNSYRGVENPTGNGFVMLDGSIVVNGTLHIADDNYNFAGDGYYDTGLVPPANGYITAWAAPYWFFWPTAVGATAYTFTYFLGGSSGGIGVPGYHTQYGTLHDTAMFSLTGGVGTRIQYTPEGV